MRCIFCKKNSHESKSVEHIIPESLGNKKAVLPKGIVCDSCNSYFSRKVEKKLLETPFYKSLRSRYGIESKKGKIPLDVGYLPVTGSEIGVELNGIWDPDDTTLRFSVPKKSDFEKIESGEINEIYIPVSIELEKSLFMSKFLAKVGVEAIANLLLEKGEDINDLINEELFDPLRNFARYGRGVKFWEYHQRRVYDEVEKGGVRQKMYEFQIWQTDGDEETKSLHFTIILYGLEFTINLFQPSIQSYTVWLEKNNFKVPI